MISSKSKSDLPPIFVVGYPGDVGGANTECWHTVKLWRRHGLNVTFVPTWKATAKWRKRLDEIGCHTIESKADRLGEVPGLRGGIVVSFCNANFLRAAARFRELGCKIVWVNCMTWLFAEERRHYRDKGTFDCYVFQSEYQRSKLESELQRFGYDSRHGHLIRGAFAIEEFPFRPLEHSKGKPFVIGRISRAAEDKYSSNTWSIYKQIDHPIQARVMAWNRRVERKVGQPPSWAECLPPGAETPQEFFGKLHCMVQANGGAGENWPRSGLEAMACGVPVIVQDQWGWREMIRHGETGYLCENDKDMAACATRLATDESLRLEMAQRARTGLEETLAEPNRIWSAWRKLLGAEAAHHGALTDKKWHCRGVQLSLPKTSR